MKNDPNVSLVLLDRDGVLNETLKGAGHRGPRTLDELRVLPDVSMLNSFLQQRGILASVVTNQPDLSRGKLLLEDELAIAREIVGRLPSGSVYLRCPHDNSEHCFCRKPQPGLLIEAMTHFDVHPAKCLMVGDRWTDVLAAKNAGVNSVLIRRPWSWKRSSQGEAPRSLSPDHEVRNLTELVSLMGASAD